MRIGAHVVIHPGTVVGDGCEIQDGAVLGKPPKLAQPLDAPRGEREPLVLEAGAVVCARAIVLAGARIGEGAILGDQSFVRERARIGAGSVIGRGSAVDNDVLVGARVRVQTDVYLTAYSVVEDDVFVGPGVDDHQRLDDGPPRRRTSRSRARCCGAPAGSAAPRCSRRASRSARRRSWPPAPWSCATCRRGRS